MAVLPAPRSITLSRLGRYSNPVPDSTASKWSWGGGGEAQRLQGMPQPSKDPLLALLLAHSAQVITCELIVDEIAL
jgi:hypothetical protein